MSSLNCTEEVELAEKLIELHPWADMVKLLEVEEKLTQLQFVLLSASGNDKVAICEHHGWHDWYLTANLKNNQNLNKHVLSLNPHGVSKSLKNTIFPFTYNNFDELKELVKKYKIGTIMMEVRRIKNLKIIFSGKELFVKNNFDF